MNKLAKYKYTRAGIPIARNEQEGNEIVQSYILTSARYDWTVWEKRILYRIVEFFNQNLKGEKLIGVTKNLWGDATFEMPIKKFLPKEDDENYTQVKKAFKKIKAKIFEYEYVNEKGQRGWKLLDIINKVDFIYGGRVKIEIQKEVFGVFYNWTKGFSRFDVIQAMSFKSTYAMRFYELFYNTQLPKQTFTIERLKEMLKIEGKYSKLSLLKKYVLDIAKRELDTHSPISFTYKTYNPHGLRKQTHIDFYLVKTGIESLNDVKKKEDRKLIDKMSVSWFIPQEVEDYLIANFGFTLKEIKNNVKLFQKANEDIKLLDWLFEISDKVKTAKNPKGFLIGALKKKLIDFDTP